MRMELVGDFRAPVPDSRRLLNRAAMYQRSEVVRRIQNKVSPPNAPLTVAGKKGARPLRDSGLLQSSITYRTSGNTAVVGTTRIGARINNEGGTIRPKKSRKLWIPADFKIKLDLRKAGSISNLIRSYKRQGYRCFMSPSGKAFLYCKKKEKPQKMFILRDKVTIPARPFMYFSNQDAEKIGRIMKEVTFEN